MARHLGSAPASWGTICWLPDLAKWAQIINHYLIPGVFFYIVEGHPFSSIFDNSKNATRLKVAVPYFHNPKPIKRLIKILLKITTFIPETAAIWLNPVLLISSLNSFGIKLRSPKIKPAKRDPSFNGRF